MVAKSSGTAPESLAPSRFDHDFDLERLKGQPAIFKVELVQALGDLGAIGPNVFAETVEIQHVAALLEVA